jgi:hypothetical protein
MNLVIVTFTCDRDAEFMHPWRDLVERCYPGAKIAVAGEDLVNLWASHGAPTAVRQALSEVAHRNPGSDWIMKTDVDVAHLRPDWFLENQDKGSVIGCQQHRQFPWGFQGLGYAIRTPFVHHMMRAYDCPTCPCKHQADEDCAMSLAAYIADPNSIFLNRFDPLGRGKFANWNTKGCLDVKLYKSRFDLVHCGTHENREDSVALMRQFAGLESF